MMTTFRQRPYVSIHAVFLFCLNVFQATDTINIHVSCSTANTLNQCFARVPSPHNLIDNPITVKYTLNSNINAYHGK